MYIGSNICITYNIKFILQIEQTNSNSKGWNLIIFQLSILDIVYLLTTKWGLYPTVVVFLKGFENGKLTFIILGLYRSTAIRICEFFSVVESIAYKTPQTINISPNFLWSKVMFQLYWMDNFSVSTWKYKQKQKT